MNAYERMGDFYHACCPKVPKDQTIGPVIMSLLPWLPNLNKIMAEEEEPKPAHYQEPIWSQAQAHRDKFVEHIHASKAFDPNSKEWFEQRHLAHIERQEFQKLGHDIMAPEGWELDKNWGRP